MNKSTPIQIRPFEVADKQILQQIDHSYHTDHVWQMKINRDDSEIGVHFKEVRLPRSMHVEYPHSEDTPSATFGPIEGFTALSDDAPVGYIQLLLGKAPHTTWISNLTVLRRLRRQGIGRSLVIQAEKWAVEKDCNRLAMESQSKNYPAICLASNMGFEFSGYSDQYYENQDIALFFTRRL